VELGYHDAKHIESDADLTSLRKEDRFKQAVKKAAEEFKASDNNLTFSLEPAAAKDGQYLVSAKDTAFEPQSGIFPVIFRIERQATADKPVAEGYGAAGDLLRKWYKEGTAAGNHGDLYDNRDGGHSLMNFKTFPQLMRVAYDEDVRNRQLHWGLQRQFIFLNAVCIGNSSTALTEGPMWRCQVRLALVEPGVPGLLHLQYSRNHLYMYPVHHDNSPGHNGQGGKGYGDVLPANTPYILLSQGSSGSDIVFLDAMAATLAALRPEVKSALAANGALMPTLQMIFRSSNRMVAKPEDYLTGKAHPSAFEGSQLDPEKMVRLAHDIQGDALPPLVQLKILEEDEPVLGRDYFDVGPREHLLDTPCAIARVVKSTKYRRRMVLSAEGSKDLRGKPLTYHWAVLRGDEKLIRIKKLNPEGSKVELLVLYHPRRPVAAGAELESNRVDIGAFVHNGVYYSAPAFICFYSLDNEKRVYDEKFHIKLVDYTDPAVRDNYVDPMLDFPKDWRDEYRYDDDGTLLGWTRIRGHQREEFTAGGRLVLQKDQQGKPVKTCPVRYVAQPVAGGMPVLKEVAEESKDKG
jgi:hypothetical protein